MTAVFTGGDLDRVQLLADGYGALTYHMHLMDVIERFEMR